MGMRLYLPKKWVGGDSSVYDDQEQDEWYARLREEMGIPETITYLPKHVIAAELIEEAAPTVSHDCIVADSGYGKRGPLRKRLREFDEPYVLEIESGRLHVIPEGTDLLEPGPTPGQGPARQYLTIPETVTPRTAGEIAQIVEADNEWIEVEWAEGVRERSRDCLLARVCRWRRTSTSDECRMKPAGCSSRTSSQQVTSQRSRRGSAGALTIIP